MMQDTTAVAKTIAQTIDVLATKFGGTGAHLWSLMVQQVRVNAITDICILAAMVMLFAIGCAMALYALKKDNDNVGAAACLVVIGSAVGGMFWALWCMDDITTALFNPEYGALKMATALLHGTH